MAFGRRKQEDREFFQTAAETVAWLEDEMRRLDGAPETRRALEIGCGPGRLMRPLAAHFAEIHGVDVSDQMIQLQERRRSASLSRSCHRAPRSERCGPPFVTGARAQNLGNWAGVRARVAPPATGGKGIRSMGIFWCSVWV